MVRQGRVGISIVGTTACAVLVRSGKPVWQQSAVLSPAEDWAELVHTLLASLPVGHRRPRSVRLALGEPYARRKPLFGIAPETSASEVSRELVSHPGSFFVGDESSLLISPASHLDGCWWAAALDRQMVAAVESACAGARIPFLGSIACANIDEDTALIDAAMTAATATHDDPFLVDPSWQRRQAAQRRRTRMSLGGLLMLAITFVLCAPAITTRWNVRQGRAALMQADSAYRQQVRTAGVPATLRRALSDASALSAESDELILLIHRLATALPDSAAFLSLKIDSVGGMLVIASRATASPLREFASIEAVGAPRLHGPMISSVISGIPVTRSTLSFQRHGSRLHTDAYAKVP